VSAGEELLALHLRAHGITAEREYRFGAVAAGGTGKGLRARLKAAGLSDWRADFAVTDAKLLIEVEGGGWTNGRHTRGTGFEADLHKYGEAQRLGWTVYRCSPAMVKSGRAITTIVDLLKVIGGNA
jgi:very-short-patch-repair endonuclease